MEGIGKYKSKYVIESVTNTKRKILVEGENVYKKNYVVQTIDEYVQFRMNHSNKEDTLVLHTPATIKYNGKLMDEIDMEAIMAAIARRIYILDCFEGIAADKVDILEHLPKLLSQNAYTESVRRYSSTHDEKISLHGIRGNAVFEQADDIAYALLYAGELIYIGKNTSLGFGRYSLSKRK